METGSDDGARGDFRRAAANDNPGPDGGPEARIEAAALRLARLLGRQIAPEHFEAGRAANDHAPADEAGDGRCAKSSRASCAVARQPR